MEDKLYKLGDKLPGSLLTEEEWQSLRGRSDSLQDIPATEYRTKVFAEAKRLARIHCVGDDEHKCIICGDEIEIKRPDHDYQYPGLCKKCQKTISYRRKLPMCGNVRWMKNPDLICRCCEERSAQFMGLCRNCYHHSTVSGIRETIALKRYVSARSRVVSKEARERMAQAGLPSEEKAKD